MDAKTDAIVANYLKKRGFSQTEASLKKESGLKDISQDAISESPIPDLILLMTGDESNNPGIYESSYSALRSFIDNSIDKYKSEMRSILYPLFIHIYLILVEKNFYDQARHFMDNFKSDHLDQHASDIGRLAAVVSPLHLRENEFIQGIKNNKYRLNMSTYTFELLLSFLQEHKYIALLKILNQNIIIKVSAIVQEGEQGFNGIYAPVMDQQKEKQEIINLGRLPPDPWLVSEIDRIMNERESAELYSVLESMKKESEGAPSRENVPLIPSKLIDVQTEIDGLQEIRKRVHLGTDSLPSICCYTFHNTYENLNDVVVSDDGSFICGAFEDSVIKVWHHHMGASGAHAATNIPLVGHSGPVYGLSMDPKSEYLFSCSEDGSARLWSLQTFTNLVVYKGHQYPVWDIDASPVGLYFATASNDKTARLWSCDHIYPLRMYVGHSADVNCIKFHPNSNYLLTGSEDHTVRLWDVQRGKCVRLLNHHHGPVMTVALSPDGKYAASAGEDRQVVLWDLAQGRAIQSSKAHSSAIHSITFSQDSNILATGGLDGTIRLWNVKTAVTQDEIASTSSSKKRGATFSNYKGFF